MSQDYSYDLIKTLFLTALGYTIIYGIKKYESLRNEPIVIGKNKPNNKIITIDIPTLWIPYESGDTKDSVTEKYRPKITVKDDNWVLNFKPITSNIHGLRVNYTPDPIKIPIIPSISQVEMAIRLVPKISSTVAPIGWSVKFPKFILLD